MTKVHHRRARRYGPSESTLFDWLAERELRNADPVVRRIARRYGLSIYHARAIAQLAGFAEQAR